MKYQKCLVSSLKFSCIIQRFLSLNLLLSWKSSSDLEDGLRALEFRIPHHSLLVESMRFGFYVPQQTHVPLSIIYPGHRLIYLIFEMRWLPLHNCGHFRYGELIEMLIQIDPLSFSSYEHPLFCSQKRTEKGNGNIPFSVLLPERFVPSFFWNLILRWLCIALSHNRHPLYFFETL